MLGVSHAVEVLVLGLLVVCKIPYISYIFNSAVVVPCVIFTHGFPDVVDIGSKYFVCLLVVLIYIICSYGYSELPVLLYLLQRLVYHMPSKTRRSSTNLRRMIGEVLVLGLLILYSSCMRVRQDIIGVVPSCYFLSGNNYSNPNNYLCIDS